MYQDALYTRRSGSGFGAAAHNSSNNYGSQKQNVTPQPRAGGGGFGYDGDEEGDILRPSSLGPWPAISTTSTGAPSVANNTGFNSHHHNDGGIPNKQHSSSNNALVACLLASCTGIEFGAGPKQLERYDRLSYDLEQYQLQQVGSNNNSGRRNNNISTQQQPSAASTYSSVLSEIVVTPLAPQLLINQMFTYVHAPSTRTTRTRNHDGSSTSASPNTQYYLRQLQDVLNDAITNAPAVPYFRDAIVKLSPSGISIYQGSSSGDRKDDVHSGVNRLPSSSSFLAHTCDYLADCLEDYATTLKRQMQLAASRQSTTSSLRDDVEAARFSIGFAQLMSGFLARKVKDALCGGSDEVGGAAVVLGQIPWEVMREVREEPLATNDSTTSGSSSNNVRSLLSTSAGLQASSPGRIVFSLNTTQEEDEEQQDGGGGENENLQLARSMYEAVDSAIRVMQQSTSSRSNSSRVGGAGADVTDAVLSAVKGVLKHISPPQMIGCVLSGFVIDVQSKLTSDGILEAVRLMSAASVLERAQIAREATVPMLTSKHLTGDFPTHSPAVNQQLPSREDTLRELRRNNNNINNYNGGLAAVGGGGGGFYDTDAASVSSGLREGKRRKGGGGFGFEDEEDGLLMSIGGGSHSSLQQSIHGRAAQKQRQRAVEDEIRRIRERERNMREDIRPAMIGASGGSARSSSRGGSQHHHVVVDVGAAGSHQSPSVHINHNNVGVVVDPAQRHVPSTSTPFYSPIPSSAESPSPAPLYVATTTTAPQQPSLPSNVVEYSDPYVLEQRIRQGIRDDALLRESSLASASSRHMLMSQNNNPIGNTHYGSGSGLDGGGVGGSSSMRGRSTASSIGGGGGSSTTLSALQAQDMYSDVGSLLNQLEREEKATERGIRMQRDRLQLTPHRQQQQSPSSSSITTIQNQSPYRGGGGSDNITASSPTATAAAAATIPKQTSSGEASSSGVTVAATTTTTPSQPRQLLADESGAEKKPEDSENSNPKPKTPTTPTIVAATASSPVRKEDGPSLLGWIAKKDPATGRMFFSNKSLGKSTWKREETDLPQLSGSSTTTTTTTPPSLETHVPGEGWKSVTDKATGKTYFANNTLKKTTWKIAETNPVLKGKNENASEDDGNREPATPVGNSDKTDDPSSTSLSGQAAQAGPIAAAAPEDGTRGAGGSSSEPAAAAAAPPTTATASTPVVVTTSENVAANPVIVSSSPAPKKSVPPPPPKKSVPPPPPAKKSVPPPPPKKSVGAAPPTAITPPSSSQIHQTLDGTTATNTDPIAQENDRRRQEEADKKAENKDTVIKTATGKSLAEALKEQQAKMEAEEKERGPRPIAVARGSTTSGENNITKSDEVDKGGEGDGATSTKVVVAPSPALPAKKGVPPPPPPKKSVPPPPPKKSVPPPPPKKSLPPLPTTTQPAPATPAAAASVIEDVDSSPASSSPVVGGSSPFTAAANPAAGNGGGGPGAGKIFGSYKEVYDPAKKRFYYRHIVSKVATWVMPEEVAALKKQQQESGTEGGTEVSSSETATAGPKVVVGANGLRTCGAWVEKKDPTSGRSYFANTETKERTWKIEQTPFA